jgi:hypothetical protein
MPADTLVVGADFEPRKNADKQYSADVPAPMRDLTAWDTPEIASTAVASNPFNDSNNRSVRPLMNRGGYPPITIRPTYPNARQQGRGRNPNHHPDTTLARVPTAPFQE